MKYGLGSGLRGSEFAQQATKRPKFKGRGTVFRYDRPLADTAPPYKEPSRPAEYGNIKTECKTKILNKRTPLLEI
jgi:hypothetical protein